MCLLVVRVRKGESEMLFREVAVIEFVNDKLVIRDVMFRTLLEVPVQNIRKLYLNSLDAVLLLELK